MNEEEQLEGVSGGKHVECEDCHNVHVAGDTLNTWSGANTNRVVNEALEGALGQTPTYPAAQADSATLGTRWVSPSSYDNATTAATYEYQVCYRCHSYANTGITNASSTWYNTAWTNVALEFNTDNASYHPVMGAVKSTRSRTTTWMLAPWNQTAANGGIGVQTMNCSDCHRSSTASTTGQGPHGSAINHVLRGTWPTKNADGSGTIGTTAMWSIGDTYTGMLCAQCHNMANINFGAHTQHTNDSRDDCVYCHITIPHGSALYGLIGDGDGTMPARYAYNNTLANMKMRAYGGNPTLDSSCYSDQAGCSTRHNTRGAGLWDW